MPPMGELARQHLVSWSAIVVGNGRVPPEFIRNAHRLPARFIRSECIFAKRLSSWSEVLACLADNSAAADTRPMINKAGADSEYVSADLQSGIRSGNAPTPAISIPIVPGNLTVNWYPHG